MKRVSLTIIMVCCMLAAAAQNVSRGGQKSAAINICDLVSDYIAPDADEGEEEECDESMNALRGAWERYLNGLPQEEGETLVVDVKNGYVCLERRSTYESVEDVGRWEMCYWNEADGKHKLFAYNVAWFRDGKYSPGQYDGLSFCRYDNAGKIDRDWPGLALDVLYDDLEPGEMPSFALPRTGKNIVVTLWKDNEKLRQTTLKWDGHGFTK